MQEVIAHQIQEGPNDIEWSQVSAVLLHHLVHFAVLVLDLLEGFERSGHLHYPPLESLQRQLLPHVLHLLFLGGHGLLHASGDRLAPGLPSDLGLHGELVIFVLGAHRALLVLLVVADVRKAIGGGITVDQIVLQTTPTEGGALLHNGNAAPGIKHDVLQAAVLQGVHKHS